MDCQLEEVLALVGQSGYKVTSMPIALEKSRVVQPVRKVVDKTAYEGPLPLQVHEPLLAGIRG